MLEGVTPDQALKVFRKVVTREGYRIKEENLPGGTMSTEWRREMALTYQDGMRRRIEIEAVATPDGRGTVVSIQVPQEYNDELISPLDPKKASWKAQGRSADQEMNILLLMKIRLELLRPD